MKNAEPRSSAVRKDRASAETWHYVSMNMDLFSIIMAILWLGGGNLIVVLSLKRQNLPLTLLLTPVVLSKLERRDWLSILGLIVITFATGIIIGPFLTN